MAWWRRLLGGGRPEAPHLVAGRWGEQVAARFLEKAGYRVVDRRVRVGRRDEIDLVVRRDRLLVFVEVKTRAREDFGRGMDAVDRSKRHSVSRAAVRYLKRLRERPEYIRFDVVEVVGGPDEQTPQIRHIEQAFALSPCYRLPW